MGKEGLEINNAHEGASANRAGEYEYGKQGELERREKEAEARAASAKKVEKLRADLLALDKQIAEAEAKMETIKAQISSGEAMAQKNPKLAELNQTLKKEYNQQRIALFDEVERLKQDREGMQHALEFEMKSKERAETL